MAKPEPFVKRTLALLPFVLLAFLATAASPAQPGAMPERHRDFLKTNCQGCHGPEKQKGKFRVDDLPLAIADLQTADR